METSQLVEHVAVGVAVIVAAIAVATDLRRRRIPNVLTFSAALAGVLYGLVTGGAAGAGHALAGLGVGFLIFLPVFLLGGMGAGDVKLMAALGAWTGATRILWVAAFGAIAGGVLALIVSFAAGYGRTLFANLWLLFAHWRVTGVKRLDALTLEHGKGPRLPYAVPIAVGLAFALWLK